MKWIVLPALATGCMSVAHDAKPTPREATIAIASGVAVSAAAFAGAQLAHDPPSIATQATVTTGVSFIPVAMMFLGDESEEHPTTEGELYSALGHAVTVGVLESMGFALGAVGPTIAAVETGNDTKRPAGRQYGAAAGTLVGLTTSALIARRMPKWARIVVGTALTGSLTTLGYQLGGGPPR